MSELSFIRVMLKALNEWFTQYSTDNTGAYSPFKRLRLKPLCAQNTSNTKEERASVFPEISFSLSENKFFHRTFHFFQDRCFLCSCRLEHESLSRGLSGKAP